MQRSAVPLLKVPNIPPCSVRYLSRVYGLSVKRKIPLLCEFLFSRFGFGQYRRYCRTCQVRQFAVISLKGLIRLIQDFYIKKSAVYAVFKIWQWTKFLAWVDKIPCLGGQNSLLGWTKFLSLIFTNIKIWIRYCCAFIEK